MKCVTARSQQFAEMMYKMDEYINKHGPDGIERLILNDNEWDLFVDGVRRGVVAATDNPNQTYTYRGVVVTF